MKPHTWDHGGGVSYERWDYWVERWQWHISFWFGTAEEQNFGCVDSPWSRQTKDITTWVYRTRHPKYYPIAWYISSKFSKSGWMSFTNKHIFMLFRFRDIPWLTFRISSTLSTSSAKASSHAWNVPCSQLMPSEWWLWQSWMAGDQDTGIIRLKYYKSYIYYETMSIDIIYTIYMIYLYNSYMVYIYIYLGKL